MNCSIVRCDNSTVTDYYLEIIKKACQHVNSNENVTITAKASDTLQAKKKKEKVIYWVQGIGPEESFMRHHSYLRLFLLSLREIKALRKADFIFFVSEYMKKHYEHKYHLSFGDRKYYIMPCFNTEIHTASFYVPEKYKNNTFAYIGSMSPWQSIDSIMATYKKIEDSSLPNCSLEIYTTEQDEAKAKLEEFRIKNYYIGYCPNESLGEVLGHVKYGFIIRDDNEVNRVSTPTKISTYLSHGLIPIFSKCLNSFYCYSKNMRFVVEENEINKKLNEFREISADEVFEEYKEVFSSYYSEEYHIEMIRKSIGNSL